MRFIIDASNFLQSVTYFIYVIAHCFLLDSAQLKWKYIYERNYKIQ